MTAVAVAPETERVIRRFAPVITDLKPLAGRGDLTGLFLDLETTGTDHQKDHIIELALVPFTFTANGAITGVGREFTWYEDPGIEIPEHITKITGITNEMVRRKRIDDALIMSLVPRASIVIAHNAEFDRKFAEKRCPSFKDVAWGCSYVDVPWKEEGFECAKLRCLMLEACSLDFDNHGAAADSHAGVHLLKTVLPSGLRALHCVLDAARSSQTRIYATGSPFEYKDVLKDRGYRWDAAKKVWHRDVRTGDPFIEEKEWLANHALCANPASMQFTAKQRFSDRIGK
jgi:DNA polymerase-3 subunit epsilon